jgi:hypothetical protein
MPSLRLEQRKLFGRRQIYELLPNSEVKINVTSLGKAESWALPLNTFSADPIRIKRVNWAPLVIVIPLVILTLVLIAAAIDSIINGNLGWITCGGIGFIFAVLTFAFAMKIESGSTNVIRFDSSDGSRLVLWFENPSRAKFEEFISTLRTAIHEAQNEPALKSGSLSAELLRLKDLHDQGILDEAQFEAAKNRIVGLEPKKTMGF